MFTYISPNQKNEWSQTWFSYGSEYKDQFDSCPDTQYLVEIKLVPMPNNPEQAIDTNRRAFCKKIPCVAMGMMASSSVLASLNSRSGLSNDAIIKNEHTMANTVTAKVISQKGTCGIGHEVGDEIIFTEDGVEGKICIHALYSFLPKVFAMMHDSQFPWLEDPDVSTSACPDAYNPVIFEISRKP